MNEQRTSLTSHQRLHKYQAMLARHLQEVRAKSVMEGFLGVQTDERHWLPSLIEADEVLGYQPPVRVPSIQPWYLGLVSVHGSLLGVIDFGLFCGKAPTGNGSSAKIMVLSRDPQRMCAIVVSYVAGLRSLNDLRPAGAMAEVGRPWLGHVWSDVQGTQ